ncbi:MAG: hypothetical protein WCB46_00465 [Methanoregula sp.]
MKPDLISRHHEGVDGLAGDPGYSGSHVLGKKISPEESRETLPEYRGFISRICLRINPAHLLDSIDLLFMHRKVVKTEAIQAKEEGFDPPSLKKILP